MAVGSYAGNALAELLAKQQINPAAQNPLARFMRPLPAQAPWQQGTPAAQPAKPVTPSQVGPPPGQQALLQQTGRGRPMSPNQPLPRKYKGPQIARLNNEQLRQLPEFAAQVQQNPGIIDEIVKMYQQRGPRYTG